MTDEDIIKALMCFSFWDEGCNRCPYLKRCNKAKRALTTFDTIEALAIFNRQKAEIERLENGLAISKKETKRYAQRRSEAIKEFVERLKGEMLKSKYNVTTSPYSRACNNVVDFWVEEINHLVKEMVGDA